MKQHALRALVGVSALLVAPAAQAFQQYESQLYLDDGSSIYYADPYQAEQASSELNYEVYSNCYGYCHAGTEYGDPDAIGFKNEGDAPDASNTTEPAGTQANPSTAPVVSFTKAFHKNEGFGNNTFGGGYTLDASLTAYSASAGVGAQLQAVGEGKIWARAFGIQQDVVRARAVGTVQQSGAVGGSFNVYAMGSEIYSTSSGVGPVSVAPMFNRTFFNAEKTIPVMGYPVKVTAKLTGTAGLSVVGELGQTVNKLTATPKGGVYATASVGVDFVVASLSVEGNLTLIEASLPVGLQLVASSCSTLDWKLTADFNVKSLSGSLKLKLKIKLFIIKISGSVTIAKWNGVTKSWNLYTGTGQNGLTFSCVNGQPVGGTGTLTGEPEPEPEPDPYPETCGGGGGYGEPYQEVTICP